MKKVVSVDNLINLEKAYLQQQYPYYIEQELLHSFRKQDLKELINTTRKSYLKEKLPYINKITKERNNINYTELDDISQHFIDMVNYYFSGGHEIETSKKFLDKLERFYKVHFQKRKYFNKQLDISSIPIRNVLERYSKLPENLGKNIRCIFPDHRDTSASFKVYEKNNSFYCFGCHRGGNILNLIAEMQNISTKEAYKVLCNLYL